MPLEPDAYMRTHFNLYRLDPASGKTLWQYYQPTWPRRTDVQDNQIMLHFSGELRVLKYLSL